MPLYEEVDAYGQRFADACHNLDAEALFNIVDPDCLLLVPGHPTISGREDVVAHITDHPTPPPLVSYPIDHYFESGDLIVVVGTVVMPDADEPLRRYLMVYKWRPDGSLGLLANAAVAGP